MKQKTIKIPGWQSWSPPKNAFFKIPFFLYPPFKYQNKISVNTKIKLKKPVLGWCSWYSCGTNINSQKIVSILKWITNHKNVPLEYVLIDDGWTVWGDWKKPDTNKFPGGLPELFQKIKSQNLKTGIWIAPFLVDKNSDIIAKHPDWVVRRRGRLFNPTELHGLLRFSPINKYLLDLNNPEVKKYIYKSLDFLIDKLKTDLLKIDFIYAIYFDPRLSKESADKVVSDMFEYIRNKYPKVYTIASGCPFDIAAGRVDSIRTGPDTLIDPFFGFKIPPFLRNLFIKNKVIPALSARLKSGIIWNIDPDSFICSPKLGIKTETIFRLSEIIKKSKGNIFLGDNLPELTNKEIDKFILPLFGLHPNPKV